MTTMTRLTRLTRSTPQRRGATVLFIALAPAASTAIAAPETEIPDVVWTHPNGGSAKFGCAVALASGRLLVGASHDAESGTAVGSAYVIRKADTIWEIEAKFLPPTPTVTDHFGTSVAMDGEVAVVSAIHDDDAAYNCGAVYVYRRFIVTWTLEAKLLPPDGQAWDEFGTSVSVSGDTIVVGSPKDDDKGINAGSAYLYRWDGTGWTLETKVLAPTGKAGDLFGFSVAASGDVAVVGAWSDNSAALDAGAAYVYRRLPAGWSLETKLVASDASYGDSFGKAVAARGNDLLVGAPSAGTNSFHPGAAYVFRNDGAGWFQQAVISPDAPDNNQKFGKSVALGDNEAVIGSGSVDKGGPAPCAAITYVRSGSTWMADLVLQPEDPEYRWFFGDAVTIDDGLVVAGDPGEGQAFLFDPQIEPPPPVPGDIDGDGCVNSSDLGLVIASFGLAVPTADIDGSGMVDSADLALVLAGWSGC